MLGAVFQSIFSSIAEVQSDFGVAAGLCGLATLKSVEDELPSLFRSLLYRRGTSHHVLLGPGFYLIEYKHPTIDSTEHYLRTCADSGGMNSNQKS